MEDDEKDLLTLITEAMHLPGGLPLPSAVHLLPLLSRPNGVLRQQHQAAALLQGHIQRLLGDPLAHKALRNVATVQWKLLPVTVLELALHYFSTNDHTALNAVSNDARALDDSVIVESVAIVGALANIEESTISPGTGVTNPQRDALLKYTALAKGAVELRHRRFSQFEASWDFVRDPFRERLAWPFCPLIGLVSHCDHLFVNMLVASQDEGVTKVEAELVRVLRTSSMRGHALFLGRLAHQMRVSRELLRAFEDFTQGNGSDRKWDSPITAKQLAVRLGRLEQSLWSVAR